MRLRLGKYLLTHRLNQGGMADVFLAKSFGFGGADQVLAIKAIRSELSADPEFVSMFVEEAKLSVILSHQNIARIFELGRLGGRHFIAMEHVFGRDLRGVHDRIVARGERLPEELALHIIAQVCDGLDYAHRKVGPSGESLNIVHRDVSPQNVLLGYDGAVKLIDFGIAKALRGRVGSQSRVLKGKYAYMSPEQVRGQPADARSDVYAVGVLLFELLTSKRLFTGGSDHSIIDKVRHGEIYPPGLVAPGMTPEAEAVVLKALAHSPRDRFQSASDMRDAVEHILVRGRVSGAPRRLASLLGELFLVERDRDQMILEETRAIAVMPEDAPGLESLPSEPVDSEHTETHMEHTDKVHVTEHTGRFKFVPQPSPTQRNALILGGATFVALLLVMWAYFATAR